MQRILWPWNEDADSLSTLVTTYWLIFFEDLQRIFPSGECQRTSFMAITWTNVDQDLKYHIGSPSHNKLKHSFSCKLSRLSNYREVSNIRSTLVGNKIVDRSDVVGASPVGAAPTTSSFSTWHLASMDWAKRTARRDEKHLCFGIGCVLY